MVMPFDRFASPWAPNAETPGTPSVRVPYQGAMPPPASDQPVTDPGYDIFARSAPQAAGVASGDPAEISDYLRIFANPNHSVWRSDDPYSQITTIIAARFFNGNRAQAERAISAAGGVPDQSQTRGGTGSPAIPSERTSISSADAAMGRQDALGSSPMPATTGQGAEAEGANPFAGLWNEGLNPFIQQLDPQQQTLFQTPPREIWSRWMDTNPAIQGMNRYGRSAVNNLMGNNIRGWEAFNLGNLDPNNPDNDFGLVDFRTALGGGGAGTNPMARIDLMGALRNTPYDSTMAADPGSTWGMLNEWLDDNGEGFLRDTLMGAAPRGIAPYIGNALSRLFSGLMEDDPTMRVSEYLRSNNFNLPWSPLWGQ